MKNYIGVDVSKQTLDVFDGSLSYTVPNEKGMKTWKKILKKQFGKDWDQIQLIYEPTGPYSLALRSFCQVNQIQAYEVNPKKSANFAKVLGNRSKTDKVDAKLLYSFQGMVLPESFTVPTNQPIIEQLKILFCSYEMIQKARIMLSNHLESQTISVIVPASTTAFFDKEIQRLQEKEDLLLVEMIQIIRQEESLDEEYQCLTSMPGVGPLLGITFLYFFHHYP